MATAGDAEHAFTIQSTSKAFSFALLIEAADRGLEVDEAVFHSEQEAGHRNPAIAHLLRAAGVFTAEPGRLAAAYFRQCSVPVAATILARIGGTLGNLGTDPATGLDVFGTGALRDTLSVIVACGMYNGAGDWACRVGLLGGPAGEKRRWRRRAGRGQPATRHRRPLAAAG